MKYCENCEYYNPNTEGHVCQCPKMVYGYYGVKPTEDNGMLVEDDECWGFVPGPKFGCIHHKEKAI